jgi:PAS domain S-box-containing protein
VIILAKENVNPHEEIMKGVQEQLKEVLEESKQAIYVYLDDHHMTYNQQFASLLGYKSIEDLSKVKEPFIDAFVTEKTQETLIHAYKHAMEDKIPSDIEIFMKRKTGEPVKVKVIMVPIAYNGELLALHFVKKI